MFHPPLTKVLQSESQSPEAEDPVLFGDAERPTQGGAPHALSGGRVAPSLQVLEHQADVGGTELDQLHLADRRVDVGVDGSLLESLGSNCDRPGESIRESVLEVILDAQELEDPGSAEPQ